MTQLVVVGSFPEEFIRTVALPESIVVFMANTNIPRLSAAEAVPWLQTKLGITTEAASEIKAWAKTTMQLAYTPAVEAILSGLRDHCVLERAGLEPEDAEAAANALLKGTQPLLRDLLIVGHSDFHASAKDRAAAHRLVYRLLKLIPQEQMTLRQVALYGLSETERGLRYVSAVERGDAREVLRLVCAAHDGDRALRDYRSRLAPTTWADERDDVAPTDDAIDIWLKRNDDLAYKAGAFQRSIPDIDEAASALFADFAGDAALRVAAAGMGGTVAVHALVQRAAEVREWLERRGWSVRRLEPAYPARVVQLLPH
eukprot:TRINITY_DN2731_c0_g1_i14.p1 TRINITY_DN2731_c0_g1~~TRINITY_DN2731_c0_g1_i14.p1  ORF type:complete len:314 (+),score=54.22 TRINITY_DN2731_c0_g1_i14:741-1682(+)